MSLKTAGLYALSLPERTLRALSAALGGLSKLLTDTLLPRSVRATSFYWYLVGNLQRFLIADLAGIRLPGRRIPDRFLLRKCVGNVAEAAGIVAFQFSPLWFFALVDDAADGARGFLQRVVAQLRREGIIHRGARIESAERLLVAISKAGAASAARVKFPPLSKKEVSALFSELRKRYAEVYRASKIALPSPKVLWKRILRVCREEEVSLLRLSAGMTLASARAAGRASGQIFYEKVVLSYGRALRRVRRKGFLRFFAIESRPYFRALSKAFSASKTSSTEKLFRKKYPHSFPPTAHLPASGP